MKWSYFIEIRLNFFLSIHFYTIWQQIINTLLLIFNVMLTVSLFPNYEFSKILSESFWDIFKEIFVIFIINFLVLRSKLRKFFNPLECLKESKYKRLLTLLKTYFWSDFNVKFHQMFQFEQSAQRIIVFKFQFDAAARIRDEV